MKTVKTLTFLTICVTSITLADDFKTTKGKEYKDATVSRIEPDGIVVKTKSGISKIYFVELPKEVQQRFNYNGQNGAAFSAANYAAALKVRSAQIENEIAMLQQQVHELGESHRTRQSPLRQNLRERLAALQDEESGVKNELNQLQVQQKQDQHNVAQHDDSNPIQASSAGGSKAAAPAATSPNNVSSEQKQVVDEMLRDLSLAFHRSLSDTEKQGLERIVQQHDAEKLSVREGQILQVMDNGIVLSKCPAWHADGRPARWLGPIFVSGSFPGAVDGALWEGWIWPAGTYKAGTSTLEHWATSLDLALKARLNQAAGQLRQGAGQLRQGTQGYSRPPVSFMQSIGGG